VLTSLTNEFKTRTQSFWFAIKVFAPYPVVLSRLKEGRKQQQQQQQQQFSPTHPDISVLSYPIISSSISEIFSPFLSRADFEGLSTAKAAPILDRPQIIRWKSLEIGAVFHVIDRITIPTVPESKHYVVLQTEQQQIIHVWITDIINQELSKYNLPMGNVFIKPLGKKKSNTTSYEYYDFDIVVDVVNLFN